MCTIVALTTIQAERVKKSLNSPFSCLPEAIKDDPNCQHKFVHFLHYLPETKRMVGKYVRVYNCLQCERKVHDDTPDGTLTLCL